MRDGQKTAQARERTDGRSAAPAGPSLMSLILAIAVLTGLSLGAGGMFGLQVLSKIGKPATRGQGGGHGRRRPQGPLFGQG